MAWPRFLTRRPPAPSSPHAAAPDQPALTPAHPNVVFLTADARYLPLAWQLARDAAAELNRNFDVVLLVLSDARAALPPAPPGCLIQAVELPPWLRRWPVPAHMSLANYIRLFAPAAWIAPWQRALYLDSDILLAGPLAPLFDLDLAGATAAMAEDCGYCRRDETAETARAHMLRHIGIDPAQTYYNAGVILLDVALWRQSEMTGRLAGFKDVQARLSGSVDQDFVNFALQGRIATLSPRWNFQTHFLGLGLEPLVAPRIFHYLDIVKPWRDKEWSQVYDRSHAIAYAARPAAPADSTAMMTRAHADAIFAQHTHKLRREQPHMRARLLRHIAAGLPHYADLSTAEKTAWAEGLRILTAEGLHILTAEGLCVETAEGLHIETAEGLRIETAKGLRIETAKGLRAS